MKKETDVSRREFLKTASLTLASPIFLKTERLLNPEYTTVINKINTERPLYAITIDDGWDSNVLERMLEMLTENKTKATFFLVGKAATGLGQRLVRKIACKGHEIAYHSDKHEEGGVIQSKSFGDWSQDYNNWKYRMKDILGETLYNCSVNPYARAPYGIFTKNFLKMCGKNNLTPYAWTHGTDGFQNKIKKGDILLLHVRENDLDALDFSLGNITNNLSATSIGGILNPQKKRSISYLKTKAKAR